MADLARETDIQKQLEAKFPGKLTNFVIARERRMFADVAAENAKSVLQYMQQSLGFDHLSTITGMDSGELFDVMYHVVSGGVVLSLRARIPASALKIETVISLFTVAEDYERELVDLLGIEVTGLPPGNRYPLPDDWPAGEYPLRKGWKQKADYPVEENKCQK